MGAEAIPVPEAKLSAKRRSAAGRTLLQVKILELRVKSVK